MSLFTNMPIELPLEIIKQRLDEDLNLADGTRLTVSDLMELIKFCLTTTYFSFQDNIYIQNAGAAMGSPLSPIAANLFMEWLEQKAIVSAPLIVSHDYGNGTLTTFWRL